MVSLAKNNTVSLLKRNADGNHKTDRQRAVKISTAKGR